MLNIIKKNNPSIFLICMGVMYLYGILSPEHYSMGSRDLYVGLKTTVLVAFGACIWFFYNSISKIGYATLTWITLLLLIILQPLINNIIYADELIFTIGALLTSAIISIITINISQEKHLLIIRNTAWVFWLGGICVLITQLLQLFFPNNTFSFIFAIEDRLYGNLAQPNQSGFVQVLAIASAIYLFYLNNKNKILKLILPLSVLLLCVGISFSISRTALILLMFVIIGTLFYRWQSHKIRAGVMIGLTAVSVAGYQIGNLLMKAYFVGFSGQGGVERLVQESVGLRPALYERAFLAIKEEPITGIGYGNYLGYGLERIEQWSWFEHAEHSHNAITQIWAELGLLGIISIMGVVIILLKQLYLFLRLQLSQEKYFICLLLSIFVLYSFSEFPLWYTKYLYVFVFLVALLDEGFYFKNLSLNKVSMVASLAILVLSFGYARFYDRYLTNYEIVMIAKVNNQQKIDAYQAFPKIFGFTRVGEEMLNMVADEDSNDPKKLIAIGDRLIKTHGKLDVMRVQARLLMKTNQSEKVDKLYRAICIAERQAYILSGTPHDNCHYILQDVKKIDPEDTMGYAARLNEWYIQRYNKQ